MTRRRSVAAVVVAVLLLPIVANAWDPAVDHDDHPEWFLALVFASALVALRVVAEVLARLPFGRR